MHIYFPSSILQARIHQPALQYNLQINFKRLQNKRKGPYCTRPDPPYCEGPSDIITECRDIRFFYGRTFFPPITAPAGGSAPAATTFARVPRVQ